MYPIKMGEFRRQVVLMLRQRAVFSDKTTAEWKVGLATRLWKRNSDLTIVTFSNFLYEERK